MFIVIDGPDGTGKTTLVKALAERLARLPGVVVKETREPHTTWLREWLSDPTVGARELLIGFAHDRNLHLREVVEPALARGEVVLCDRYVYSTLAYQTLHNPPALVEALVEGVRKSDLALVLTCPLDTAMARIVARGLPPDRYDHKRDIQAKVATAYAVCAARDPFAVKVDASGTPEETLSDAWSVVLSALWARGLITRDIASRFVDGHGKPCERLDYSKPPAGYKVYSEQDGWVWDFVCHPADDAWGDANDESTALTNAWAFHKRHNDPPLPHHPWRGVGSNDAGHAFRYAFTTPEGATILETRGLSEYEARRAAWHWYDTNVIGLKVPDLVPDYTSKRRSGLAGAALTYSKPPPRYEVGPEGWSAPNGACGRVGTTEYTYPDALGWAWQHYKLHNPPPLPLHPEQGARRDGWHRLSYAFCTLDGKEIAGTCGVNEAVANAAAWCWYDINVLGDSRAPR